MANIEPQKTSKELYEDWKPLIEAEQDAAVQVDERLEAEKLWVEQVNGGRGVTAGGPGDGRFPLEKKTNARFDLIEDEVFDHDNDF